MSGLPWPSQLPAPRINLGLDLAGGSHLLLEADPAQLRIVTTNCGMRVERIDEARAQQLFAELEKYGVRHDDADPRNITYRFSDGRFCLIDFEFATILPEPT